MSSRVNRARRGRSWRRMVGCGVASLAAGASGTSHAQSAVTLYGVIDSGVEYVTNIGAQKSSSVHVPTLTATLPSLWGLRGKEDLGGGLSTVFVLESGFAPGQGTLNQGGREFGRQAYVGLSSVRWGTLTLGRQYSQIFWAVLTGDTLAPNIYAAADLDPYLTQPRVDNAIAYTFKASGLTVAAMYSFGRDAVDSAPAGGCAQSTTNWQACKAMSAMVKYDAGKWGVAAAVDRNYGGGGTGSPLPVSSQTDTRAVIDGYMKFGNSTIGAGFQHRINHGVQTPTLYDATSNYWWIGGSYLPRPDIALDAQFGHISVRNSAGGSVIAARAMYLLSKRTAVYVTAGRVFNQRNASFSIDGGVVPPASTPLPGVNQTGALVGIRHLF